MKEFIVGSKVFFSNKEGFESNNNDILILDDNPQGYKHYTLGFIDGRSVFKWAKKSKEEFLTYAKRDTAYAMEFGKFLVPEFIKEIGLTIEDLTNLYAFYKDKIDSNHAYQKIIAEAYIENNSFTLTDAQLDAAYENYLEARKTKTKEELEKEKSTKLS